MSQAQHLDRVADKIDDDILAFCAEQGATPFHMADLVAYVDLLSELRGPIPAPDSSSRILRYLRKQKRLNYVVLDRRASLYQFIPVVHEEAQQEAA